MNASATLLTWVGCVAVVCSCGTTATIHKRDGSIIEARIERSDATAIYVKGCHTVSRFNQKGKRTLVELHCDDDGKPEALQAFTYGKRGLVKEVEMDICADGKVDRRMRYFIHKPTGRRVRKGNPKAAAEMDFPNLVKSRCYPDSPPPEFDEVGIPRAQIEDIDHPGDIQAFIISPITALGLGMIVWRSICLGLCNASDECKPDEGLTYRRMALGFILVLAFSPATIWGWYHWFRSRSAAAPPDWLQIGPQAMSDGRRTYYGIGLSWSW